jgi:LAS superfamily LD-carboxypeptidase LdcB
MDLTPEQLTGLLDSHIEYRGEGCGLLRSCWQAYDELRQAATAAGFDMQIASAFRSFDRQREIWNAKVRGTRPVHDDRGRCLNLDELDPGGKIRAIMRYSALPGASRHHWGTDLDVFDAGAVPADYRLQLSPEEVAPDGVFARFHAWLDERIEAGEAFGFARPYDSDRGGVAPERWHLSYAPLADGYAENLTVELLSAALRDSELELLELVLQHLDEIYARFIRLPTQGGD